MKDSKFYSLYNALIKEAKLDEPEEEDQDTGNINFDSEDLGELGDEDMDSNMEATPQVSVKVDSPHILDLLSLAINCLNFKGNYDKSISDKYTAGKNDLEILNYIEHVVGYPELEEDTILEIIGNPESGELDFDPTPIAGKSISDRLSFYNQHSGVLPDSDLSLWTNVILNCINDESGNYGLTLSSISKQTVDSIYSLLIQNFNFESKGMFDSLVKDRTTGSSLKGPGVF